MFIPSPHTTTIEHERLCSFSMVAAYVFHHHTSTTTERERVCSFSVVVACFFHHHTPPPSNTSASARFRWWWLVFSVTTHHHHRTRAPLLVFNGDGLCFPSPHLHHHRTRARLLVFDGGLFFHHHTSTTTEHEHLCSFSRVVVWTMTTSAHMSRETIRRNHEVSGHLLVSWLCCLWSRHL